MRPAITKIAAVLILLIIAAASAILIIEQNSRVKISAQIIRVACIGDSITEWSHYPEELQQKLGEGYIVGNFGVAGSAVTKDSELPYMNQSAFQEAKDFQPQVVIIMLGTNDAKDVNYDFSGVTVPKNDHDLYTLSYEQFVVPLVKAVQEQQTEIEQLKQQNDTLLKRLDALEKK
jgi:lysophospholipase L1-like esterase